MRAALLLVPVLLAVAGCDCQSTTLVHTNLNGGPSATDGGGAGAGGGGGSGGGQGGSTGSGGDASVPFDAGTPANWCASDCDCPAGQRCLSTGTGELAQNECQPGTSTCTQGCGGPCGAGLQCLGGTCVVIPCTGNSCPATSLGPSVAGHYFTYYELDIHEFAANASDILKLLNLLNAALNGGANCSAQTDPVGQLMCIVFNQAAQGVHAPPWVSQLLTVLSDAFKFGDRPLRARGEMTLAEYPNGKVAGAEVWKELWMDYNGQLLDVMNSHTLGANGKITVTVPAFGGSRSATEVFLGPRDVEFDVNKLLVNLFNVLISAGSQGRVHDVGGLLQVALCDNVPQTSSAYLTCMTAAQQFASQFELNSGLGGLHFTQQRAVIHDLDGDGVADALGLPTAMGSVTGDMSNGFTSGALGPFPKSEWYGTK